MTSETTVPNCEGDHSVFQPQHLSIMSAVTYWIGINEASETPVNQYDTVPYAKQSIQKTIAEKSAMNFQLTSKTSNYI